MLKPAMTLFSFCIICRFAEKEHITNSDDAEEVSSTSKSEQPVEEPKEEQKELIDAASSQVDLIDSCDKNGATTTRLGDDDDLMIIS